jgi:hypothetical protein
MALAGYLDSESIDLDIVELHQAAGFVEDARSVG